MCVMIAVQRLTPVVLVILHSNEKLRVHAFVFARNVPCSSCYRRFFRLIDKGLRPLVKLNWGPSLWLIPFIPFFDVFGLVLHARGTLHAQKVRHDPLSLS